MKWASKNLGDLCEFIRGPFGGSLKKEIFVKQGFAVYEQQHAIYDQFDSVRYFIDSVKFNELKRFELRCGDLIMSCSGTLGKVAVAPLKLKRGVINQALLKITPSKDVDVNYLKHFMESESFQSMLMNETHGAAIKNVASVSVLKKIKIPFPPLAEQQRIAALLDTADRILKQRESAIAKLDQLAESVFIDMFGDPLKPKCKFETIKLGQLITEMRGGASLKPEDFVESGFPILHKGAIKKNGLIEIDLRKKTFATVQYANHKKASVVTKDFMAVTLRDLVPTGPSIGLIVNLNDGSYNEYLLAQGAYGFKIDLNRITPEYLIALSNMASFREVLKKYSVGSTQIHMRGPVFTGLQINLPDISLQQKFSQVIKNIWKLRSVQNSFLEKEKVLINSLQHQSFAVN
jgi:type I restriction enzyme S subunit